MFATELQAIDRQIENLKAFRKEVAEALKTCERSLEVHPTDDFCPILEAVSRDG